MRVLIYSVYFAPDLTGNGKYAGEMAAWLVQQGHSVRVVTAPPHYPMWVRDSRYGPFAYRRERHEGATVWRAPLWIPNSPGGFARLLHMLSFALTSLPLMLRQALWSPDIVLTVAPGVICAPTGWLTARLCGAKAWVHLQDFEVEVAFELGLLKGARLQRLALGVERWMLRRFDRVSTISRRMVERLIGKGVARERVNLFPNWVDISHITPTADGQRFRGQWRIAANAIVLLYSGTLGAKQGLQIIPATAALLTHRPDIVFVICGEGQLKSELEASAEGLPNLRLLPLQPFEQLGELLAMADIHLLPQSPGAADLVLPSKLSGMLASGRPVIATCRAGSELGEVVASCGIMVPPKDSAELAAAILRLVDDPKGRQELGRCARAWAEANVEIDAVLGKAFGSTAPLKITPPKEIESLTSASSDSPV